MTKEATKYLVNFKPITTFSLKDRLFIWLGIEINSDCFYIELPNYYYNKKDVLITHRGVRLHILQKENEAIINKIKSLLGIYLKNVK
jgi:hypothetical protein